MIVLANIIDCVRLGSFFEIKYDMIQNKKRPGAYMLGSFFEIKYDMMY